MRYSVKKCINESWTVLDKFNVRLSLEVCNCWCFLICKPFRVKQNTVRGFPLKFWTPLGLLKDDIVWDRCGYVDLKIRASIVACIIADDKMTNAFFLSPSFLHCVP